MADQKRRATVLSIVLLLLVFGSGVYLSSRLLLGRSALPFGDGRVGVLPIGGVIYADRSFGRDLAELSDREEVKAFVLEIRSPGGSVGASQDLFGQIKRLREEDDRPVVAWIGDVGASGGYYVALGADSILALPGSMTGSIGVILQLPHAEELLKKMGVGIEVVKSGEYKDMGSIARSLSEEERAVLEELVNDVYEQFVAAVVENRDLTREEVMRVADGRVISGKRAQELGLVDGLGTLQEAIDRAAGMAGLGENPPTVRPGQRKIGLIDLLSGVAEGRLREWMPWMERPRAAGPQLLYLWR
jgi:protease-4